MAGWLNGKGMLYTQRILFSHKMGVNLPPVTIYLIWRIVNGRNQAAEGLLHDLTQMWYVNTYGFTDGKSQRSEG